MKHKVGDIVLVNEEEAYQAIIRSLPGKDGSSYLVERQNHKNQDGCRSVAEKEIVQRVVFSKKGKWFWEDVEGDVVGPFKSKEKAYRSGVENLWMNEG